MALRVRRTRRQTEGRFKLRESEWVDPYPHIPGTEPEKRVFAMLKQMGIYFIYQGQVPEFEKGGEYWNLAPPKYKPDFVLPEYKLIIDPFSPFHHSQEEAVERDVRKVVAYAAAGYAYYHPWALGGNVWTWDQYHDLSKTLNLGTSRTYKPIKQTAYKYKGQLYSSISGVDPKLIKKVKVVTGYRKIDRPNIVQLYQGVNAARNRYRGISRAISGQRLSTFAMLQSIPELVRGPRYKLTDPRDIKAKRSPGYRIGQYLGAGANSVAAANRKRRSTPLMMLSTGQRRLRRRRK